MTELPDPLVPPDVDLRGFSGFMLDVNRLLASELVALGTPEECWAAVMLWCRAWQQSPAGSLPDDDRILSAFSGAGTRWKKVRDMAMRGFIKCSDGRLYHPVLCEEVVSAWRRRQGYRADQERLKKWRAEKRGNGKGNSTETPGETPDETRFMAVSDTAMKRHGNADETGRQGQGQGQGLVQEPPVVPHADPPPWGHRAWLACWQPHAAKWAEDPNRAGMGLRPVVGGWYADVIWEKIKEAGSLPENRYDEPGKIAPVAEWLDAGIEPDDIYAAIQRVAARPGYSPPDSLRYFDSPVRSRHKAPA